MKKPYYYQIARLAIEGFSKGSETGCTDLTLNLNGKELEIDFSRNGSIDIYFEETKHSGVSKEMALTIVNEIFGGLK